MKLKKNVCVILLMVVFSAGAAFADSYEFSLTLLPGTGNVTAPAGTTIGWGYTITNLDSNNWLETTAINSDLFQNGTPDASIFDLPILAPGTTITVPYVAGISGLFDFTWNADVPVGFINQGTFLLSGDFFAGDPLAGGNFLQSGLDAPAAYSVTVSNSTSTVPEPSTVVLLFGGLMAVSLIKSRRTLTRRAAGREAA